MCKKGYFELLQKIRFWNTNALSTLSACLLVCYSIRFYIISSSTKKACCRFWGCVFHRKKYLALSAGAQQRGNIIWGCFFQGGRSCSESACHTNPDQIHCHLASSSADELNVHHSATGIHYGAVGTLNAIACYEAIDANSFCHMEAKDKLLLIMLEDV